MPVRGRNVGTYGQEVGTEPRDIGHRCKVEPHHCRPECLAFQPRSNRGVRQPPLAGVASGTDRVDAIDTRPVHQFFREPGLADACLTADHEQPPSRGGRAPRVKQSIPFRLPAHERIHCRARRRWRCGCRSVEIEDFAVSDSRGRARLNAEFFFQQRGALLVEMQGGGTLAAAGVTAHERAPSLFVKRLEPQQLVRTLDGLGETAIMLEDGDQPDQDLLCTMMNPFTIGADPLARTVREERSAVQDSCLLQRGSVPLQAAIGRGLESDHVHDRAGFTTPRNGPRAHIDQGLHAWPAFAQMMQFAA